MNLAEKFLQETPALPHPPDHKGEEREMRKRIRLARRRVMSDDPEEAQAAEQEIRDIKAQMGWDRPDFRGHGYMKP